MSYDRILIAPLDVGLQRNVRPWLISDDAFSELTNCYMFRGRVEKRFGGLLINQSTAYNNRLRLSVGTTDGAGNIAAAIPAGTGGRIGQTFTVGTAIFTVWQAAGAMLSTSAATGTFTVATGAFTINGAAINTAVYFYPSLPVMGLITQENTIGASAINDEVTIAFDTRFAYKFVGGATGAWQRVGAAQWSGTNVDFFWGANYQGVNTDENSSILFVTNNVVADQIKYLNNVGVWTNFNPVYNLAGGRIETARLIMPFKDRLLLFSTTENPGAIRYPQRCRFSQNGSAVAVDAWRQDIVGKGGFIDAPTREEITSCQYLQDRLIVFFERSTWELVFVGNVAVPFVWRKVNTELGVESPFSVIPFDRVVLGIGDTGIHSCSGNNVERIDSKIPDEVSQFRNADDGVRRVHGIRDYYTEFAYWTFPSVNSTTVFSDRVLLYNYRNGSWAYNDDSITCFGYFQNQSSWPTWADMGDTTWGEADFAWNAGTMQRAFRNIAAGNQTGFVWIVSSGENSSPQNAAVLPITNITTPGTDVIYVTIVDHNLKTGDYIQINRAQGCTFLNGGIYKVIDLIPANPDIVGIIIDPANPLDPVWPVPFTAYTGGGTVQRVSVMNILTKQYNFYVDKSRNASIAKIDFMVDATDFGQVTVNCLTSTNNFSVNSKLLDTAPYPSINMETLAIRLWHPIYTSIEGECIQLQITQSDAQLRDAPNSLGKFTLHAMLFYAMPTTHYLQ